MTDQLEQGVRAALNDRAAQLDPDALARLSAIDYRPRRSRRTLPAIGALGTATVAGAISAVVFLGSSAPAFAGWKATPTKAADGQIAAASQSCGQGLGTPALTEARGPYTAAIYADQDSSTICLAGDSLAMSVYSSVGQASAPADGNITFDGSGERDATGDQLTLADGQTGAGVTGVTIELSDGTSVQATVSNGYYMAWWPGTVTATNAEITTAAGTSTVDYPAAPSLPACPASAAGRCSASYSSSSAGAGSGQATQTTSVSAGGTGSGQ